MNKKQISLALQLILFWGATGSGFAQINRGADSSKLIITQDMRIDALLEKTMHIEKGLEGMPGYRVQISFGSSKKEALEIKAAFTESYADHEGYVVYDIPYFKVRVGNFRTHLAAEKILREIKEEYTGAFIVRDLIPIPEMEERKD